MAQRNTSKTASYHWSRGGPWRAGRPSPSTYTPLYSPSLSIHTLRKPHLALSICCQFTHLSPSPLLHPSGSASLCTFRLSFLPSPCAHPSTLSARHQSCCQDEWQHWPPGTCCFINMADSSGSAVWPLKQLQYVAGRFSLPRNTKLLEDSCRVDTTGSTTTPSGACVLPSEDT